MDLLQKQWLAFKKVNCPPDIPAEATEVMRLAFWAGMQVGFNIVRTVGAQPADVRETVVAGVFAEIEAHNRDVISRAEELGL
jgi:hypothetical protein